MQHRPRLIIGGLLGSLALAGCGVNGHVNATSPVSGTGQRPTAKKAAAPSLTTLNPAWIMPNRLPVSTHTKWERINWPMYNTQLAMNQFPAAWHGNDLINTWKLPPKWVPYLMKNEKPAPAFVNGHRDLRRRYDPLTLYITLQGTVFLYPQTVLQSQWPGTLTVGAIPPTTIVAEFVPLKPAVEAGIIPESSNQPASSGPVFPIWQKTLGMTATQIKQAFYWKKPVH